MRLVKRVEELEAAGTARAAEPGAVGVVWTQQEETVDAEALAPGEYIAVDVTVLGCDPPMWRLRERVTAEADDLGDVYEDATGRAIGRVVGIEGTLITWEQLPPDPDVE